MCGRLECSGFQNRGYLSYGSSILFTPVFALWCISSTKVSEALGLGALPSGAVERKEVKMKKKYRKLKRRFRRENPMVGGYRVPRKVAASFRAILPSSDQLTEEDIALLKDNLVDVPALPELEKLYKE